MKAVVVDGINRDDYYDIVSTVTFLFILFIFSWQEKHSF